MRPGKNEPATQSARQKRTYKGFAWNSATAAKWKSLAVSQAEGRRGVLWFAEGYYLVGINSWRILEGVFRRAFNPVQLLFTPNQ
jgi:hypothetical protein